MKKKILWVALLSIVSTPFSGLKVFAIDAEDTTRIKVNKTASAETTGQIQEIFSKLDDKTKERLQILQMGMQEILKDKKKFNKELDQLKTTTPVATHSIDALKSLKTAIYIGSGVTLCTSIVLNILQCKKFKGELNNNIPYIGLGIGLSVLPVITASLTYFGFPKTIVLKNDHTKIEALKKKADENFTKINYLTMMGFAEELEVLNSLHQLKNPTE